MRTRRRSNSSVEGVQQAYFEWLCGIIDKRRHGLDPEYRELATELHKIEFYDLIPNDDNRVVDGLKLREAFLDGERYGNDGDLIGSCSVLEMLVALAMRMEDICYSPSKGNQTSKWFWLLVKNCGLKLYMPDDPNAEQRRQINRMIVRKMIERKYDVSGHGCGLFPLRSPSCDQRKQEIWYQMMEYLEENDK